MFLLFAVGVNGATIAVVVFIVAMLLWVIGGATGYFAGEGPLRRAGGSIIPWLAVASLAYLTLG